MTIVTNTSTTHTGLLVTGSGDDIEIDVELIGGRTLRLSADGNELGAWPVEDCHIEEDPQREGSFRIMVDGDDAVFTPTDPVRFRVLIQGFAGSDATTDHDPAQGTDGETDPQTGDGAAGDPVAFLFGSSSPPAPAGSGVLPDHEPTAANDLDRADEAPDHMSPVEEALTPPPDAFGLPDDDVEIDGGAVEDSSVDLDPVDQVEEIEPGEAVRGHDAVGDVIVDDAAVDEFFVSEPEPELDLFPAEPEPDVVSADDTEVAYVVDHTAPDSGDGEGSRGRFGGSALERLSAAIGSITSNTTSAEGEADPYELGPNTVAEDVLSTQRSLRDHQLKDAARGRRLKIAAWIAGIAGVVAVFAVLTPPAMDFIQNYEGGAAPPPPLPVSATTVPTSTTTVVDETGSPESSPTSTVAQAGGVTTIFDRPAPEFVALWDSIAGPVDEVLEFDAYPVLGPFEEQFTPYLTLLGVVEPQGTIEEFSLVVDPSGPGNYDRVGLQALGVAIATVDPARSPAGRAALLGELGLNVRQPDLDGIDGTVETGGVVYTLVYDEATTLLTLTVAPAG